jgi:Ca2+-binding RTX toxin-like protein
VIDTAQAAARTHVDLPVVIDLAAATADPDGDPVFFRITGTAGGTAEPGARPGQILFHPEAGRAGPASVTVVADDGFGAGAAVSVPVTISDAPLVALRFEQRAPHFAEPGGALAIGVIADFADQAGVAVPAGFVDLSVDDPAVANLTPEGVLRAVGDGHANLTARRDGIAAATVVGVGITDQDDDLLTLTGGLDAYPDAVTILPEGGSRQIVTTIGRDATTFVGPASSGTRYVSGDASIVQVGPDGMMTAGRAGETTVTVMHGYAEEVLRITVAAPIEAASAAIGPAGGVLRTPDGVEIALGAGQVPGTATVSAERVAPEALGLAPPPDFEAAGGLRLDLGTAGIDGPVQIAAPVDTAVAQPGDDVYFFRRIRAPVGPDGAIAPVWAVFDSGVVDAEGIARTASPPFPGFRTDAGDERYSRGDILIARASKPVVPIRFNLILALGRQLTTASVGSPRALVATAGLVTAGIASMAHSAVTGLIAVALGPADDPLELDVWTDFRSIDTDGDGQPDEERATPPVRYALAARSGGDPDPRFRNVEIDLPPPAAPPDAGLGAPAVLEADVTPDGNGAALIAIVGEGFAHPAVEGIDFGDITDVGYAPFLGDGLADLRVAFRTGGLERYVYGADFIERTFDTEGRATLSLTAPADILLGEAEIFVDRAAAFYPAGDGPAWPEDTAFERSAPFRVTNRGGFGFAGVSLFDDQNRAALEVFDGGAVPGEADRLITQIPLPPGSVRAREIVPAPDRSAIYVGTRLGVHILDGFSLGLVDLDPTEAVDQTIELPGGAEAVALEIDPAGRYLYAAEGGRVHVIDLDPASPDYRRVAQSIALTETDVFIPYSDGWLWDMAVNADGTRLFVTMPGMQSASNPGLPFGNTGALIVVNVDEADRPPASAAPGENPRRWREAILHEAVEGMPREIEASAQRDRVAFLRRADRSDLADKALILADIDSDDPNAFALKLTEVDIELQGPGERPGVRAGIGGGYVRTGPTGSDLNISAPTDLALSPDGRYAFIADFYSSRLVRQTYLDERAFAFEQLIDTGSKIGVVSLDPANPRMLGATTPIPGGNLSSVALSDDGARLYASFEGAQTIAVYDVAELTAAAETDTQAKVEPLDRPRGETPSPINIVPAIPVEGFLPQGLALQQTAALRLFPQEPVKVHVAEGEEPEDLVLTWRLTGSAAAAGEDVAPYRSRLFFSALPAGAGLWPDDPPRGGVRREGVVGPGIDEDANPGRVYTSPQGGSGFFFEGGKRYVVSWNGEPGAPVEITEAMLSLPPDDDIGNPRDYTQVVFDPLFAKALTAGASYNWGVEIEGRADRASMTVDVAPVPARTDGTFSSVTVLTHGFDRFADRDRRFGALDAEPAILETARLITEASDGAAVLAYDKRSGDWVWIDPRLPADAQDFETPVRNAAALQRANGGAVVLIFDWHGESNAMRSGYAEAAGDALFASLAELDRQHGEAIAGNAAAPALPVLSSPLHFIGHGRGAVVNSEAIQRLGIVFPQIDGIHMTTLDPRDIPQASRDILLSQLTAEFDRIVGDPAYRKTEESDLFLNEALYYFGRYLTDAIWRIPGVSFVAGLLGTNRGLIYSDFADPDILVWDNIGFADNYYQSAAAGNEGFTLTPRGRALGSAANIDARLSVGGFEFDDFGASGYGGVSDRLWAWYAGTIDPSAPRFAGSTIDETIWRRPADAGLELPAIVFEPTLADGGDPLSVRFSANALSTEPWYQTRPDWLVQQDPIVRALLGRDRFAPDFPLAVTEAIGQGWYFSSLGGGAAFRPAPLSSLVAPEQPDEPRRAAYQADPEDRPFTTQVSTSALDPEARGQVRVVTRRENDGVFRRSISKEPVEWVFNGGFDYGLEGLSPAAGRDVLPPLVGSRDVFDFSLPGWSQHLGEGFGFDFGDTVAGLGTALNLTWDGFLSRFGIERPEYAGVQDIDIDLTSLLVWEKSPWFIGTLTGLDDALAGGIDSVIGLLPNTNDFGLFSDITDNVIEAFIARDRARNGWLANATDAVNLLGYFEPLIEDAIGQARAGAVNALGTPLEPPASFTVSTRDGPVEIVPDTLADFILPVTTWFPDPGDDRWSNLNDRGVDSLRAFMNRLGAWLSADTTAAPDLPDAPDHADHALLFGAEDVISQSIQMVTTAGLALATAGVVFPNPSVLVGLGIAFGASVVDYLLTQGLRLDTIRHNRIWIPETATALTFEVFSPLTIDNVSSIEVSFWEPDATLPERPDPIDPDNANRRLPAGLERLHRAEVALESAFYQSRQYSVPIPEALRGRAVAVSFNSGGFTDVLDWKTINGTLIGNASEEAEAVAENLPDVLLAALETELGRSIGGTARDQLILLFQQSSINFANLTTELIEGGKSDDWLAAYSRLRTALADDAVRILAGIDDLGVERILGALAEGLGRVLAVFDLIDLDNAIETLFLLDNISLEVAQPLRAEGEAGGGADLTAEALAMAVEAAEALWRGAEVVGDTALAALEGVETVIGDLAGDLVATFHDGLVTFDRDAAGFGWFLDATPEFHEEFVPVSAAHELTALPGSPADGAIDLLSVVTHELGHALGLRDLPLSAGPAVMAAVLEPGRRLLPSAADLGGVAAPAEPLAQPPAAPLRLRAATAGAESVEAPAASTLPAPGPLLNRGFAESSPSSPDFGWVVSGDVSIGGGVARLRESAAVFSGISQRFAAPDVPSLSFTLSDLVLGATGDGPPDALEVALLRDDGSAAVGPLAGLGETDALLNIQADGTVRFADGVTVSGVAASGDMLPAGGGPITVTVPLSAVAAGEAVTLHVDLLGLGAQDGSVTVGPVGFVPPVAVDDTVLVQRDTATVLPVLGNDIDPAGAGLSLVLVKAPANGTATLDGEGRLVYTPDPGFTGADSLRYRVSDGVAESVAATVSIAVQALVDTAVPVDDAAETAEDVPVSVAVLGNDALPDGTSPVVEITDGPAHGTAEVLADGRIRYVPAADYNGADSLTYRVRTGTTVSEAATLSLTVTPVNDAPTLSDAAAALDEDTAALLAIGGADVDGDALVAEIVTPPQHGTAEVLADGSIRYVPDADFNGADTLVWRVSDGVAVSRAATYSLTVRPVNDAPVAMALAGSTAEDTPLTLVPRGSDVDGDALVAEIVGQPAQGAVALDGAGRLVYTPAADFVGSDSFAYRLSDGAAASAAVAVDVTVTPVNDAPVAEALSGTLDEDTALVLRPVARDIDSPAGDLTVAGVTQPAHGRVTITPDGLLRYVPAPDFSGSDSFSYTMTDGSAISAPAPVTLQVRNVNDAPVAVDGVLAVPLNTAHVFGVIGPGRDADGDALRLEVLSPPAFGTLTQAADGRSLVYTPQRNYLGADSFTYRVSDGTLSSGAATMTLEVRRFPDDPGFVLDPPAPPPPPPAAETAVEPATAPMPEPVPPLAARLDAEPAPLPGAQGRAGDTRAVRGGGVSLPVNLPIEVRPLRDPPYAGPDLRNQRDGLAARHAVLTNDFDPDSDSLTVRIVTGPTVGTARVEADGSITYSAPAGYEGIVQIVYEVTDYDGCTHRTTLSVVVHGAAPAAATPGDDVILDGATARRLAGGAGADVIFAGGGDDTLIGGAGDDLLVGQDGADLFVVALGQGDTDRLADLDFATGDALLLTGGAAGQFAPLAGRAGLSVDAEGRTLRVGSAAGLRALAASALAEARPLRRGGTWLRLGAGDAALTLELPRVALGLEGEKAGRRHEQRAALHGEAAVRAAAGPQAPMLAPRLCPVPTVTAEGAPAPLQPGLPLVLDLPPGTRAASFRLDAGAGLRLDGVTPGAGWPELAEAWLATAEGDAGQPATVLHIRTETRFDAGPYTLWLDAALQPAHDGAVRVTAEVVSWEAPVEQAADLAEQAVPGLAALAIGRRPRRPRRL